MELDDKTPMEEIEGIDQAIIDEIMADEGGGAGVEPGAVGSQTQTQTQVPSQTPASAAAAGQQSAPVQQFDPFQAYTAMQNQMQQMAQVLQQLAKQPQAQPQVQQPPKDEDPLIGIVRQHLDAILPNQLKPIQDMQQQWQQMQQQQQRQANLERSVSVAQNKYPDFIDVVAPIHQRMLTDPAFNELILGMPDPAEFAYTMALGMQAQVSRVSQGQAQVNKMQQMAAMPRSMQVKSGGAPSAFDSLEDMIDNFENLTPAQQAKLLKLTNRSE
ncbi:conserved hypothetical protein [uncultured Sporomusa sp.]|uniref:Uncharacterized protein n=1 Tax=uncultured Sporomusa sp. TaxID=307249 RepID=A0A212LY42_9FIRM|nr:hypothetical protein [uncultured Sporomusa sp.]SCM82400.1 conserved hypothetical protein [uncultured Sporomusa sp.]